MKCPWCNMETDLKLELQDEFLTKETFQIHECNHCGLLTTYPPPPTENLGQYYKSDKYYSHNNSAKGLVPFLYRKIKVINNRNKCNIALMNLKQGKVLDIGCGTGDFLSQAKNQRWEVVGIEPNDKARDISRQKLSTHCFKPSEIETIPAKSFDVITMWHVLEHVVNLKDEITQLDRLIKDNGRVVIALPNFKSHDAEYYGAKWAAWDVPRHLHHFCKSTINSVMGAFGFELQYIKPLLWDSYYISYLSEQYCGHSLPLLRGLKRGIISNIKAKTSGEYSSLVFVYKKLTKM